MAACQSCGMPISKDPEGGGTLADGSFTIEYCSHCYRDGQFTEPDLSLDQMILKVKGKMREGMELFPTPTKLLPNS